MRLAVLAEASGDHCSGGGFRIVSGTDTDADGGLDSAEIFATVYACHVMSTTVTLDRMLVVQAEAAGDNCSEGGLRISSGLDADGDGRLGASEVTATRYVCSNSSTAISGTSDVLQFSTEDTGDNCSAGGTKIESGADANQNGVLDASEVSSTRYVCKDSGVAATVVTAEAAGSTCALGGMTWSSGNDSDADGGLSADEVSTTGTACNAAAVSVVSVATATQSMASNIVYKATDEDEQVVFTLPDSDSLSAGDTVTVVGVGAGGWKIVQNDGQSIDTSAMGADALSGVAGSTWTSGDASVLPRAASASGRYMAGIGSDGVYVSSDYGVTWSNRLQMSVRWQAVSATGRYMTTTSQSGYLYTSDDFGVTWTQRGTEQNWYGVTMSASGQYQVAAVEGGYLYSSEDYGVTWTQRATTQKWFQVTSSRSGQYLTAAAADDSIVANSSDYGVTWTTVSTSQKIFAIASSANGKLVFAGAWDYGNVNTSSDFGENWTVQSGSTESDWYELAVSASGQYILGGNYSYPEISDDYGATWTQQESLGSGYWQGAVASDDFTHLAISSGSTRYYYSTAATATATTTGSNGALDGGDQYESVTLEYLGDGKFEVVAYSGQLNVE